MKKIIIFCVLCIIFIFGLLQADKIRQFSATSLRYNAGISGQTAYRSRQYAIANPETFWVTFWSETNVLISTPYKETNTSAINFSGDGALVWNEKYLTGGVPGAYDAYGIAVSEALAHRLWGSTNIVGQPVEIDGEEKIIRGVFRGNTDLVLISFHIEDTSVDWHNAELSGGGKYPTRRDAESFAMASGLGRPDYILTGNAIFLAGFMSVIPILTIGAYLFFILVRFLKMYFPFFYPFIFIVVIIFAVFLPILLDALPPWLIPTHWSDFSFWSELLNQGVNSLREFLSITPTLRDVEFRLQFLRQFGILLIFLLAKYVKIS